MNPIAGGPAYYVLHPQKGITIKKKESDSTNIVQQRFVGPKRPFNG